MKIEKRVITPNDFHHPSWNIESYDLTRYFIELNKVFPNNTLYAGNNYGQGYIGYDLLLEKIEALKGTILYKSTTNNLGVRKLYVRIKDEFLIIEGIHIKNGDNFDGMKPEDSVLVANNVTIMHKSENIPDYLEKILEECILPSLDIPMVGIISRDNNGFFLSDVRVDTTTNTDLELHYGGGFNDFHEKMITRICDSTKGILLLHGDPGTGKSHYIRRLILDIKQNSDKKVIIIPNGLIGYLVDPEFNTFLIETIESFQYEDDDYLDDSEDEKTSGIIIILEDAESVLMKRERGETNQAISNILNLTDGLLNDVFGIQIVATYNTDDENIDPAIMRKKRLIGKRSFKKLTIEEATKLATFLEVKDISISEPMTVAEVYSLLDKDEDDILIETQSTKKGNVKFKI